MFYSDQYEEVNYSIEVSAESSSPEFCISSSSIRADICLYTFHHIKIWGKLMGPHALPLAYVSLLLLGIHTSNSDFTCSLICEATTDANGFYLIEHDCQSSICYQLVVYEPNSFYNKIYNIPLNHCVFHSSGEMACREVVLDYLNVSFPFLFTSQHIRTSCLPTSHIKKKYSIPAYRQ